MMAIKQGISDVFHVQFRDALCFYKENQAYFYFSNEDIDRWKAEGEQFLKKNYLQKFLTFTSNLRGAFYDHIAKINDTDLKKISDVELLHLFQNYFSLVIDSSGIYLGSAPEGVFFVDKHLREILQKHIDADHVQDVYATICMPDEIDFILQEKFDWLILCKKPSVEDEELLEHARTYAANFFNTYSRHAAISYLRNRLNSTDILELKKEVSATKKNVAELNKKRDTLLKKLPKEANVLSNVIRKLAVDRLWLKNCWQGAEFLALPLFEEIARRIGIGVESLFRSYGLEDIRIFLADGDTLSEKQIKNREQYLMFTLLDQFLQASDGVEAHEKIDLFFKDYDVATGGTVSGQAATNASAVGRAFVILVEGIEEFREASKQFREGDILVTTMTSPNMLLLMKKAAGVVTNEGGVCSHAAVVSRELGMPCVVGTHDATRIFKTGDYVYINAPEGEVSKVDKAFFEENKSILEQSTVTMRAAKYGHQKIKQSSALHKYILGFEEVGKEDILSVGGKGANLGEMFGTFPVPKGLCVTTHAFNTFVQSLKKDLQKKVDTINYEDLVLMEDVAGEIREKIFNQSWSADLEQDIREAYERVFGSGMLVSVRSSATAEDLPNASFAGQQDTYLYVEGIEDVLESIKKCFASLYTARAIVYRKKNNVSELGLSMAVVVQKMIDPDFAGVGFSVDPISKSEHMVLMEAARGVGEHVVSGSTIPDTYMHDTKTNEIKKRLSGDEQIMEDAQIRELSKIIKAIESYYEYPQDVEWAMDENGKFWILQSRPITTL